MENEFWAGVILIILICIGVIGYIIFQWLKRKVMAFEQQVLSNMATLIERSQHHSETLESVLEQQKTTNGRVTKLEIGQTELKGEIKLIDSDLKGLKENTQALTKTTDKNQNFISTVKSNWQVLVFAAGIVVWILEKFVIK